MGPAGSSPTSGTGAGEQAGLGEGDAGGAIAAGDEPPGAAGTGGAAAGAVPGDGGQAVGYRALDPAAFGSPVQIPGAFRLAESPIWDPCAHRLLFSEVQGGTGTGVIHALDADGQVSVFMENTGNANGLAFDIDGSLILTQMKPAHVARLDRTGNLSAIEPAGSMLHTPDDVVVRSDGTIYFSDGDFCPAGALLGYLSALPVYGLSPGASTLVNAGTVRGPNGIELSPDEKTLYVNGFGEGAVWAFDVATDGSLAKRSAPLATGLSNPDSLCLDAAGNLYVAVTTGLQVLSPDGSPIALIPVASGTGSCLTAGVTNCTFGGDDGRTLYITTWTGLWKMENMPIPGLDWLVAQQRVRCDSETIGTD